MRPAIAIVTLALALAACAGSRNSPAYKAGYFDGCQTAGAKGGSFRKGAVRNDNLFATNADYRAGWNTGFSVCGRRGQEPGTIPGQEIPQPGPHS